MEKGTGHNMTFIKDLPIVLMRFGKIVSESCTNYRSEAKKALCLKRFKPR